MAQHNKAFRCDDGDYDGDNGAEHGGNHNNQSINNAKISPEITPDLTSSLDQRPDPLKATPTTVTYDELMGIVGGFGVAQFLVFLSYSLGIFVECQVVMAFVFAAGAHRDHHCREPGRGLSVVCGVVECGKCDCLSVVGVDGLCWFGVVGVVWFGGCGVCGLWFGVVWCVWFGVVGVVCVVCGLVSLVCVLSMFDLVKCNSEIK